MKWEDEEFDVGFYFAMGWAYLTGILIGLCLLFYVLLSNSRRDYRELQQYVERLQYQKAN